MRHLYKILFLCALLLISGCSARNDNNAQTVSSENTNYYSKVSGSLNDEIVKSNVMFYNRNYSTFLGIKYKEYNTYGSGFIYDEDVNYYYVLTNYHVVTYNYSYNHNELYLEDYLGNKYETEVLSSDINYDLAIVRFKKENRLKVLKFGSNVEVRNSIKALGNPDSIKNVITNGQITCFSNINMNSNKSKVNFEVIVHSAKIDGGSSGGALLNTDNEVIGITFAGAFDKNGEFVNGYAIPVEKIKEFINK